VKPHRNNRAGDRIQALTAGLIPSCRDNEMQSVYRRSKRRAREDIIPWEWIVDETRELSGFQLVDPAACLVRR